MTHSPAISAWHRLLDTLRDAGDVVTGPIGAEDEREHAEGVRHLLRLVSIGHEMIVEKGDPTRPEFTRWMRSWRKVFGDNPRTVYDAALIDGSATYVVRGTRGSSTYLGVCAYGTAEDGGRRIVANVDDTDLPLEDGCFTVIVGPAGVSVPAGAAHLVTEPDVTDLMVRQYVHDPDGEELGEYTIEAVDDAGAPAPLDELTIARRLDAMGAWVRDVIELEASLSSLSASVSSSVFRHGGEFVDSEGQQVDPNVDLGIVRKVMPAASIQYSGQWFDDLGDDEALVITGTAPTCRYWSIQLLTRWMESGDWVHHPVFLTGQDVSVDDEGRFRVVVAHKDPGGVDWLSTTGLKNANIAIRALLADGVLDVEFARVALPLT